VTQIKKIKKLQMLENMKTAKMVDDLSSEERIFAVILSKINLVF